MAHQVDFESFKYIQFEVRATDGVHSDTTTVYVTVTDANDIRPMFTNVFKNTEKPAYTPIGTTIGQVHANDNDTGLCAVE